MNTNETIQNACTNATRKTSDRAATAALSIGAVVLMSLIVVIGSGWFDRPAHAEMAQKGRSYSAMTTHASNEEVLYLIDDRSEALMVYRVQNARQVDLLAVESLPNLFTRAKAAYEASNVRNRRP